MFWLFIYLGIGLLVTAIILAWLFYHYDPYAHLTSNNDDNINSYGTIKERNYDNDE